MAWVKNLYYSGDQGPQSEHNAYMRDKCIRDYENSDALIPRSIGAKTTYNDPIGTSNKYEEFKTAVCKGPYWNNSNNTKKLKLKFVSKNFRDYLQKKKDIAHIESLFKPPEKIGSSTNEEIQYFNKIYTTQKESIEKKYSHLLPSDTQLFSKLEEIIKKNKSMLGGSRRRSKRRSTRRR
jgi:hypothetical protein